MTSTPLNFGNNERSDRTLDDERIWLPYVSPLAYARRGRDVMSAGVALQVDIGGFTATVEAHSRAGTSGLERVSELIDRCFSMLVNVIDSHGGIVHTFPGDAAIAIWESGPTALDESIALALGCARELTARSGPELGLQLKAGVGAGELIIAPVGGASGRYEMLASGAAMDQMSHALRHAAAGEVVVSPDVVALTDGRLNVVRINDRCHRVLGAPFVNKRMRAAREHSFPVALSGFVPDIVRARVPAGLQNWVGEFRDASVTLIQIDSGESISIDAVSATFRDVQNIVEAHGGAVFQLSHDDKGIVVLAATGVASAYENDPDRALSIATESAEVLRAKGLQGNVGVASGRIFCGLLGSRLRFEYRLIGTVLNIAGRLMSLEQGVLCDEPTRKQSREFTFEPAARIVLKGLDEPRATFRILGDRMSAQRGSDPARDEFTKPMFGREAETDRAQDWLRQNLRTEAAARSPVLVFIGDAGIGKSRLASFVADAARSEGATVLVGQNAAHTAKMTLRGFLPVLEQLLDVDSRTAAGIRAEIVRLLQDDPRAAELVPLLEDIYPFGFEQTEITQDMVGATRASNRLNVMARVLRAAAESNAAAGRTIVVLLEDAHWMDPGSWTLLEVLCAVEQTPFRFCVTLRPEPNHAGADIPLLRRDTTLLVRVGRLGVSAIEELIQSATGAEHVTPHLVELVQKRTEGNPYFCEELLFALLDLGVVEVCDGTATVDLNRREFAVVPASVDKILRSRIDRLPLAEQITLKTASVLGHRFDAALLREVHAARGAAQLTSDLERLIEASLINRTSEQGATATYAFRHLITRDAAYAGLLHSQRRELHAAVARALEVRPASEGDALEIFQHWCAAAEPERALRYVDAAGERALLTGDYHVAETYYAFGVSHVAANASASGSTLERWRQKLGEIYVALGRHDAARRHLEDALHDFGAGVPRTKPGLLGGIGVQLARQLRHRILGADKPPSERQHGNVRAAEAYEQLGYVYYASGETLLGVHAALRIMNLAERAEVSPVLARAYASMSLAVSVTPLRRVANFYAHAARDVCTAMNDAYITGWVEWILALPAAGEGRWDDVLAGTDAASIAAARASDQRLLVMSSITRSWGLNAQGEHEAARQLARNVLEIARSHGSHLWEAWALTAEAEAQLADGEFVEVARTAQRALDILAEESDLTEEIRARGMLAIALLNLGLEAKAQDVARTALRQMQGLELTAFNLFDGFARTCEVHVVLFEKSIARNDDTAHQYAQQAKTACAALRRFARVFPVAAPRYWHLYGRYLAARGKRGRAVNLITRAIAAAHQRDMPTEAELASHALQALEPVQRDPMPEADPGATTGIESELELGGRSARSDERVG